MFALVESNLLPGKGNPSLALSAASIRHLAAGTRKTQTGAAIPVIDTKLYPALAFRLGIKVIIRTLESFGEDNASPRPGGQS